MALTLASNRKATGVKVLYSFDNNGGESNILNDIVAIPIATSNSDGRRRRPDNANYVTERTNDDTGWINDVSKKTNVVTKRTHDDTKKTKRTRSCRMIAVVMLGVVVLWIVSVISGVLVYHVIKGHMENVTTSKGENNTKVEDLKATISHLVTEVYELKNIVHTLKERTDSTNNGTRLDRRMDQLEGAVQTLVANENIGIDDSTKLDRRLVGLESAVKNLQNRSDDTTDTKVAFMVHSPTGKLTDDDVPTFDNIVLNMGGAYDVTSGKFRCPLGGLYLFTITVWGSSSRGKAIVCDVFKNGQRITAVHKEKHYFDSASVTLLLALSSGNYVHLECHNWQNVYTNYYTLFAGALIKAE